MSSTSHTLPHDFRVGRPRGFLHWLFLRSVAGELIMVLTGLVMMAAAIILIVAERSHGVSLPLFNAAFLICRCVAGLFGLAMLVSAVNPRGAESTRKETLSTAVWGGIIIAAAVLGLGLVVAITGVFGFCLAAVGVLLARDYVGSARPTR